MKGKFITLYGINNIGKSTQAQVLTEKLISEGYDAEFLKYPNYSVSPSGQFLDSLLRGHGDQKISEDELQLWFVLNRYQFQNEVLAKLEAGKVLVVEDYVGTGIAWGMAKGLERSWLEAVNTGLLKEDLAIYLYGQRHLGAKEVSHIHEQNDELVERCRVIHDKLARRYKWKKIQICGGISDIAAIIWNVVSKFLNK